MNPKKIGPSTVSEKICSSAGVPTVTHALPVAQNAVPCSGAIGSLGPERA
jgi:hypothetical protein